MAWMDSLLPYRAIVSARFRMLLQYRIAAVAGVWTQVVFGLVLIMIYEAFYSSSTRAQPMAFAQVASYVWLGQALLAMQPWSVDSEVRAMVRSGAVVYELCRPVDLYWLWYARSIALRTAPTAMRSLPIVVMAVVVLPAVGLGEWRLAAPASASAGVGFAAALVGALVLGCALTTLVSVSVLWLVGGESVVMVLITLVGLCSGMIVPLPLMPAWAQSVLAWLPFAGLVDLPFRVYTGHIASADVAWVVARQLGWAIALIALGRWLLGRAVRRLVVQGG